MRSATLAVAGMTRLLQCAYALPRSLPPARRVARTRLRRRSGLPKHLVLPAHKHEAAIDVPAAGAASGQAPNAAVAPASGAATMHGVRAHPTALSGTTARPAARVTHGKLSAQAGDSDAATRALLTVSSGARGASAASATASAAPALLGDESSRASQALADRRGRTTSFATAGRKDAPRADAGEHQQWAAVRAASGRLVASTPAPKHVPLHIAGLRADVDSGSLHVLGGHAPHPQSRSTGNRYNGYKLAVGPTAGRRASQPAPMPAQQAVGAGRKVSGAREVSSGAAGTEGRGAHGSDGVQHGRRSRGA